MFWKWLSEKTGTISNFGYQQLWLSEKNGDYQQHWLSEKTGTISNFGYRKKRGLSATLAIGKNGDYQQHWLSGKKWWFVRVKSHHPTLCSSHSMRYQKFSIGRDIFRYDGTLYLKDFDYSIGVTALKRRKRLQNTYGRKRRHQDHDQVDT